MAVSVRSRELKNDGDDGKCCYLLMHKKLESDKRNRLRQWIIVLTMGRIWGLVVV